MSEITYPNYDDAVDLFDKLSATCSPSYVHGVICGYICFDISFDPKNWLYGEIDRDPILKKLDRSKWESTLDVVVDLFNISSNRLHAAEFEFDLFLPDEDEELMYRTIALSSWCVGFMEVYSLVSKNLKLSTESQEVIDYVKETAYVYADGEGDNEEEQAFFEVYEFIRLAPLLLFLELHINSTQLDHVVH